MNGAKPMRLVDAVRAAKLPPPETRRRVRLDAGVSLGEMGDELGVTAVTVLRWEQGTTAPTRQHAIAYRELLDALREATA